MTETRLREAAELVRRGWLRKSLRRRYANGTHHCAIGALLTAHGVEYAGMRAEVAVPGGRGFHVMPFAHPLIRDDIKALAGVIVAQGRVRSCRGVRDVSVITRFNDLQAHDAEDVAIMMEKAAIQRESEV